MTNAELAAALRQIAEHHARRAVDLINDGATNPNEHGSIAAQATLAWDRMQHRAEVDEAAAQVTGPTMEPNDGMRCK